MTVRYIVRFPDPKTHYIEVEARIPCGLQPEMEVFMPVWTPGSYLMREYARNVECVRAFGNDGTLLPVLKSRKNRWLVSTGGGGSITLAYRVYCREMSVRTNWVEDEFALLNGASTFITSVDALGWQHEVRLELPPGWQTSVSALEGMPDGHPHHYIAPDFDTLVDSPVVAGNPSVQMFEIAGIAHLLVHSGDSALWDLPRAAQDAERLLRSQSDFWGGVPYSRYVLFNIVAEAAGGLEHRNSACLMTNRWAMSKESSYLDWLRLVSHEYFHVWNVKRLRPVELGPFDYENENYTRSLWMAEGFTEYYGDLMMARAGFVTPEQYVGEFLSGLIDSLQKTPGRLVQSAADSSFDAWIKLYRPNENSVNSGISYYVKGAVAAWLLDVKIRRETAGQKSLDSVMLAAIEQYGNDVGFTADDLVRLAERVAGMSLQTFFEQAFFSAGELDYAEALGWFGLRWKTFEGDPNARAWIGADTRVDAGRLVITKVPLGTPAFDAGLNVDDEILALGAHRVPADKWAQRLELYRPGTQVEILIARRERLKTIALTFATEPSKFQLELDPNATGEQRSNLTAWLGTALLKL